MLLAQMPQNDLIRLLDVINLDKVGTNTITDRKVLLDEIEQIRKQGYAVSMSELVEGAASVAVPIRNYSQAVAMCVLGPQIRMCNRIKGILDNLRKTVPAIEKSLGRKTH